MQLAFFILSLQLAYTASAGESVRFGENAGLRRRQSSSILQAGQVQEEGGVRLSRNRARLRSRQPEIIDTTEEDNKVVIDAEKHDKKENRKGVRKGVKKSAKKKASDGLLKQQILNRLVTTEPVQIAKEIDGSEPVSGRKVLKRKKGRKIARTESDTLEAEQILQSDPVSSVKSSRHRLPIGRSYRRRPLSSKTDQETGDETTTKPETTTTVNPVLIWRQQAALAEQKSNPLRNGIRSGPAVGSGISRRRKNFRRNNGKEKDKQVKDGNSDLSKKQLDAVEKSHHTPVPFSIRIKSIDTPEKRNKDILKAKHSSDRSSSSRSFSFNNTNSISEEIKPQTEIGRTSTRLIPSLRKNKHTFSSDNSDKKLGKDNIGHSFRRLNHQKENQSTLINGQSVSEPEESKVKEDHNKIVRRPRIKPSKSGKSKETTSQSRSSVTTSVTSTSFSVTHNGKRTIENAAAKQESIDKKDNLPPRRRGRFPPRRGKNETVSDKGTHSKTSKRVDLRLKSKIDPRARIRGNPLKADSSKLNEESILTSTPSTRANIAEKTNKKVQEQFPRLTETNLATSEHKINRELQGQNKSSDIVRLSTDLLQKESIAGKETETISQLKSEMETKDRESSGKEPQLNQPKAEEFTFRLENERNPTSTQKDTAKQNTNVGLEGNDRPAIASRNVLRSKSFRGGNKKQSTISNSGRNRRPLPSNRDIERSKTSTKPQVDNRLIRFNPRIRNRGRILDKAEDKDSIKPIRISNRQPNNQQSSQTENSAAKQLSTNQIIDDDPASINENIRNTLRNKEAVAHLTNVSNKGGTVVETDSTNVSDTLKTNRKPLGGASAEPNYEKKTNLQEKLPTRRLISGSRRRGHVPKQQTSDLDPGSAIKDNNKVSEVERPRSFNHRFRQRFTSSNRHKSDEDAKHVGSHARQSGRARNRLTVQTAPKTQGASQTEAVKSVPKNYFDIAYKHAQVTWAQDPFRKSSDDTEGPKFDIDYTKDPNYNSADNEGPVGTFSNFGNEEESVSTIPQQIPSIPRRLSSTHLADQIQEENIQPRDFQSLSSDSFPRRLPTSNLGNKIQEENIKLRDFQTVSSESFGSFSEADPVFIPLFTPDLTKHVPEDSPLFEPFTISVHL